MSLINRADPNWSPRGLEPEAERALSSTANSKEGEDKKVVPKRLNEANMVR
jgi:hypothetical protein